MSFFLTGNIIICLYIKVYANKNLNSTVKNIMTLWLPFYDNSTYNLACRNRNYHSMLAEVASNCG